MGAHKPHRQAEPWDSAKGHVAWQHGGGRAGALLQAGHAAHARRGAPLGRRPDAVAPTSAGAPARLASGGPGLMAAGRMSHPWHPRRCLMRGCPRATVYPCVRGDASQDLRGSHSGCGHNHGGVGLHAAEALTSAAAQHHAGRARGVMGACLVRVQHLDWVWALLARLGNPHRPSHGHGWA